MVTATRTPDDPGHLSSARIFYWFSPVLGVFSTIACAIALSVRRSGPKARFYNALGAVSGLMSFALFLVATTGGMPNLLYGGLFVSFVILGIVSILIETGAISIPDPDARKILEMKKARVALLAATTPDEFNRLGETLLATTSPSDALFRYEELREISNAVDGLLYWDRKLDEFLKQKKFDFGLISGHLGDIYSTSQEPLRIYERFAIFREKGYDFSADTSAEVLEALVQVPIRSPSGTTYFPQQTASIHLVDPKWNLDVEINPAHSMAAKKLAHSIETHVRAAGPKAASVDDIASLIQGIIAGNKSQAEKIEELDALRYKRLLSDQDFKKAAATILGI